MPIPPDEYTAGTLAAALDDALNAYAFAGSGEPSGSTYLVTQAGSKISIRLGPEVINNLDAFVVLPEGTIARTAFVPGFVADGGPSYNALSTQSLNPLLQNMGSWNNVKRYSYGDIDYAGEWRSERKASAQLLAGSWTQAALPLLITSTGATNTWHAEKRRVCAAC